MDGYFFSISSIHLLIFCSLSLLNGLFFNRNAVLVKPHQQWLQFNSKSAICVPSTPLTHNVRYTSDMTYDAFQQVYTSKYEHPRMNWGRSLPFVNWEAASVPSGHETERATSPGHADIIHSHTEPLQTTECERSQTVQENWRKPPRLDLNPLMRVYAPMLNV